MATKNKPTGQNGAGNKITLAPGTEYEREHTLKILRGKQYKDRHLKLLETFGELEAVSQASGPGQFKAVIDTIKNLFGYEFFVEELLPFALGMETKEEREYLENLTPMEMFMAYSEGASYIVSGNAAPGVQAALKK